MLALAYPISELKLTGGDNRGFPQTVEATQGISLLEDSVGAGTLAPTQVVIDSGRKDGAWTAEAREQQSALAAALGGDPEVANVETPAGIEVGEGPPSPAALALARKANLVDGDSRYIQIRAPGRHDTGSEEAQDLVERIRDDYIPEAGIPASQVWVTGAPAFGVDFIDTAYGAFPYLVIAVLLLTYFVLMRAFRSVFLPLKAVLMNVLSVTATYGALVLVFQHGIGADVVGWQESAQIEAWIPVMLFAILFGLSMDYEVFLLSRMREEWDKGVSNEEAVAAGIQHTGRIITAAAVIMIAAFAGFTAGRFVNLQMFGFGLSAAILPDATIVRALMVPSVMKLLGDWNWYLPDRLARFVRTVERPTAPAPMGETHEVVREDGLLRIDVDWTDRTVRVRLEGTLDLATHGRLARTLEKVETEDPELMVLELAAVSYLDSAGIAELVGAHRRARAAGRRLLLTRGPDPIERVLEVAGLDGLFERQSN
jgi:RND superfamily putative drug exporter